ncbi:hypothetical protein CBR_g38900 [Chara braunii]|uniref:Saccharopine dehydrogenase NADP binding domain-containing protein n=1 Tax=Chara braunii TaxID=69332 RepID=A0A388LQK4_CHABU|nr:hypothetical protein CBR_g38900 [Chara braunii]|eukprot:GBG84618.1 hypothetical protein CBR_g38900 [Chara braunii]
MGSGVGGRGLGNGGRRRQVGTGKSGQGKANGGKGQGNARTHGAKYQLGREGTNRCGGIQGGANGRRVRTVSVGGTWDTIDACRCMAMANVRRRGAGRRGRRGSRDEETGSEREVEIGRQRWGSIRGSGEKEAGMGREVAGGRSGEGGQRRESGSGERGGDRWREAGIGGEVGIGGKKPESGVRWGSESRGRDRGIRKEVGKGRLRSEIASREDIINEAPPLAAFQKKMANRLLIRSHRVSMASEASILVYGATGYTGNLVAQKVKELGLSATLAGRNAEKVKTVADKVQLPYEVLDLSDSAKLDDLVGRHKLVLHMAGPYAVTSPPMLEACLRKKVHYLDVTGEARVVEAVKSRSEEAKSSGLTLMPAVGFDAAVGDAVAAHLKRRLPTATHLDLGLMVPRASTANMPSTSKSMSMSRGTMKSVLFSILPDGGLAMRDGNLVQESVAARHRKFDLDGDDKGMSFSSFPACEIIVAGHSTGIPNISSYMPGNMKLPPAGLVRMVRPLLTTNAFQKVAGFAVDLFTQPGPEPKDVEGVHMSAVGEARDEAGGKVARAIATVGAPYPFTASCSLEVARRILQGDFKPGFQTTTSAYGPDFLVSIPGETTEVKDLP